jgi:cell division septal protein FtsQ
MRKSLLSLIALLLISGAAYLLGWSSILTVKSIEVVGAPSPSATAQVLALSGIAPGQKLARVEPRVIESQVMRAKWIAAAAISRNWVNGTVTVKISSREAIFNFNGRYLDKAGVIFDLPQGVSPRKIGKITAPSLELAQVGEAVYLDLPSEMQSQLAGISVASSTRIDLIMNIANQPLTVHWGAKSQTSLKVQVFQRLIALPENKKITVMDLIAPTAPVVR